MSFPVRHVARVENLLILIWIIVLVRLIGPDVVPVEYGAGLMGLYVLSSLNRLRRQFLGLYLLVSLQTFFVSLLWPVSVA